MANGDDDDGEALLGDAEQLIEKWRKHGERFARGGSLPKLADAARQAIAENLNQNHH